MWHFHHPACDQFFVNSSGVIVHKGSNTAKIIGIILGIFLLLAAGAVFLIYLKRRNKRASRSH